jgi:hypothetical protein
MPDVELDAAVVLSDWNVDANGQIKDDFADPAIGRGSGRKGGVVFANNGAAPLKLKARPGARVQVASRQRRDRASRDRRDKRRKDPHRGRRRPTERAVRTAQEPVPMGPGARFELMFDMPRNPRADVRLDLRGDVGAADQPFIPIASEGEPVDVRAEPLRLAANRGCRRK